MHAALERFWGSVERTLPSPPDPAWRMYFVTGVAEIAANIVRHAYPDRPAPGPMLLRLRAYPRCIEASFTDQGIAFVQPAPPAPVAEYDLPAIPEGGRGLALTRAVADRLDYSRTPEGENRWRLVKCF